MLADPITVAANVTTGLEHPELKLAIVRSDGIGSERRDTNAGGYASIINHSTTKQGSERHYMQLLQTKDATSPYNPAIVQKQIASVSLTINRPSFGFTDADMIKLVSAMLDTLNDSEVTPAKLLQFQS
jgi:hypothetical protein